MESLDKVLKRGRMVKKDPIRENNQRMQSFITEVPGLIVFVQRALNARVIHASFFEIDELTPAPFLTHDVMVALSKTAPRHWHFGYQRTLVGTPQGHLTPECYRFYLVPAKHPSPVVNLHKFARRIAMAQRRLLKGERLTPTEKISFAKVKPQPREKQFSFRLDFVHICNDDEASGVPTEFMRFVTELEMTYRT